MTKQTQSRNKRSLAHSKPSTPTWTKMKQQTKIQPARAAAQRSVTVSKASYCNVNNARRTPIKIRTQTIAAGNTGKLRAAIKDVIQRRAPTP